MYCRQCGKPRGGNTTTAEEDEKPKATEEEARARTEEHGQATAEEEAITKPTGEEAGRFTSSLQEGDASICSCGQVFMPDAMYCRQCGKPRGGNTTTAEEDEKPKATEASQAESAILTERIDSPTTVSFEKDPFMYV